VNYWNRFFVRVLKGKGLDECNKGQPGVLQKLGRGWDIVQTQPQEFWITISSILASKFQTSLRRNGVMSSSPSLEFERRIFLAKARSRNLGRINFLRLA